MEETIINNSEGAAEGVSEEVGDRVSMVELDNMNGLLKVVLLHCFLLFYLQKKKNQSLPN